MRRIIHSDVDIDDLDHSAAGCILIVSSLKIDLFHRLIYFNICDSIRFLALSCNI